MAVSYIFNIESLFSPLMAGLYIHIPFCKQACHYCDFHFSTSLKYKERMLFALEQEIIQRAAELENIETIYFGGGTPSLLSVKEINHLFHVIQQYTSDWRNVSEITLEANPDDLTPFYLQTLVKTPINRLSIGVQSFFDEDLRWMNRAHNTKMAKQAIKHAKNLGFDITMDLIYGSPTTSNEMWTDNLHTWLAFDLPHLSAYCLTVERNTALERMIKSGKVRQPLHERAIKQFEILIKFCEDHHIIQYEISNFCKPDNEAIHNSNYWFGKPYVGIGPSAHSFDGKKTRRMNIAHNLKYIRAIESRLPFFELETLSLVDQINEYLLTRLRTAKGFSLEDFSRRFGRTYAEEISSTLQKHIHRKNVTITNDTVQLTDNGKLISDGIIADLFIINEL